MTDLAASPLVAMLAQSLVADTAGRDAIVRRLSDVEDVRLQFGLPKGDALNGVIAAHIEQLVKEADSVPAGYRPARGGRVRIAARARNDAVRNHFLDAAAKVLASPDLPFEFVMLVGYLSPGAITETYRLYADPTLDDFTSLRADDIAFRHRFHTEHAPFDEVDVVWVKRTATIGRDRRQPRRAVEEARFLEGELMDAADAGSALPTSIEGAASDEPFCVSFTCCKRTSVCRPRRG